jgi:peptidoglycan biosynthesis protein MviN/MurJ (putative lipid II flippase)
LANLPSRAFVAVKKVNTLIVIGLAGTVVLIALDLTLGWTLGFMGLALAYSLMSCFTLGLWFMAIRYHFPGFQWAKLASAARLSTLAVTGMALVCFSLKSTLMSLFPSTLVGTAAVITLTGLGGALSYGGIIILYNRRRATVKIG